MPSLPLVPTWQRALFALVPALMSAPAVAAPSFAVDARLQMGVGGDKLATVSYADGSHSDLKLGTYAQLALGAVVTPVHVGAHALDVEALVAYASWSTGPENTDDRLKLGRWPLELLAYYRVVPPTLPIAVRLGGGLAYHLVGGVRGSGSLEGYDLDVKNALGWVAELGVVYDVFSFAVRYTGMTYRVGPAELAMDGSQLAASIGLVIPRLGPNPSADAAAE